MANYYANVKTNYFHVTDEEEYARLFDMLTSEDEVHDFTGTDENGKLLHGFGCYGCIEYYDETSDNYDFELWIKKLQKILPEGEAFIMMESGSEKLRYVTGFAWIATRSDYDFIDLETAANDKAKEMLGGDNE